MKRLLLSCLFTSLIQMPVMAQELRGFADIHNHQFANLAFGGKIVVGQAYGPISEALSPSLDRGNHGPEHIRDFLGGLMTERVCPPSVPVLELLGAPYSNDGYSSFSGWPNFWEVTHQKVYQDWLFRAVQGGLRLMVMLAVDSPTLCHSANNDGRDCDNEMATIDLQINAAYAMQEYIDQLSGGSGRGWYRIVTTPAEARRVIRQGKLAVVLGIETAHLFNCKSNAPCDWHNALQKYWRKGVRHFFIIHQDDTAFGGAAFFQLCVQGQRNWLGTQPWRLIAPYDLTTRPCPQYEFAGGRCNAAGLTQTGRDLIQELMRLGAIIDVDHMSDRAFAETLDLAEHRGYPVVASHAGFNEI
ncbi:MAG: membrane dipeptidase, partial [Candidatus Hadarchaeum sp.]